MARAARRMSGERRCCKADGEGSPQVDQPSRPVATGGMLAILTRGGRRLVWLPLIVCALNGAPASSPALAQAVGVEQPRSIAPLPPRRPAELGGAQTPAPVLPAPPVEQAAPDLPTGLTPRPEHPPYDRRSMRICGEEWQAMKRAGGTSGKIWRDFAAECLNRNPV